MSCHLLRLDIEEGCKEVRWLHSYQSESAVIIEFEDGRGCFFGIVISSIIAYVINAFSYLRHYLQEVMRGRHSAYVGRGGDDRFAQLCAQCFGEDLLCESDAYAAVVGYE